MRKIFYFAFLSSLILVSCKKENEPEVTEEPFIQEVSFSPFFGSDKMTSLNQVWVMDNGWKMKCNGIKILFTELNLDGEEIFRSAYYDFPNEYQDVFYRKEMKSKLGGGLSVNLGVSATYNHADPSAFPVDDPLNILNASDMHWSWNPGYIFYKLDFILDTMMVEGQDNFNHIVSYHIGLDNNLKTVEETNAVSHSLGANKQQLRMKVDFKSLLFNSENLTMLRDESISHSTGPQAPTASRLANKFSANFTTY